MKTIMSFQYDGAESELCMSFICAFIFTLPDLTLVALLYTLIHDERDERIDPLQPVGFSQAMWALTT
jgi:hypothetical protein